MLKPPRIAALSQVPQLFRDFRWDPTATFGSCFTFNFDTTSYRSTGHAGVQHGMHLVRVWLYVRMRHHSGSSYGVQAHKLSLLSGLAVTLYNDEAEYLCTSESAGFKISLQDQPEYPFPEINGFYAATGVLTSAAIKRVDI